jgi:predicted ATPase
LKLATESFSTPFIFDQPEDDLDNEFIIDHLLPIFREIKKYRQVIIATHNANLVVNADSEQVIIATNRDEILTYDAGSLENPTIRTRICDILEGGEKAFLKREKRYGILQPVR